MSIRQQTNAFARPDDVLGVKHLAISFALYIAALWLGVTFWGNWPVVAFAALLYTGGAIRLFGVQHDCGHFAYFSNHYLNVWCGVILGAFTSNAFHTMRYNHNRHHAYIGNIDYAECHEVWTMTVRDYVSAPISTRLAYRAYRSLPAMYLIGPIFTFFIRYRFPRNALRVGWWDAALQNTLMILLWCGVFLAAGSVGIKFMVCAGITAAVIGSIMVYSGHNHEDTYWERSGEVDFEEASLKGASVLTLGPVFDFMTFNFAYHDLHHLNSRVPCYHLKLCHEALRDQLNPTRLGFWEALSSIQWKLWDEEQGRMVRFSDLNHLPALHPAE